MLAVSGEGVVARKVAVLVHEHGVDIEIPAFSSAQELLERGVEGVDTLHALHLVGIGVHFLRDGCDGDNIDVRLRLVLTDVLDERFIALDKGVYVRADLVQAEHEINVMKVIRVVERQRREIERAENIVHDRAGAVNAAHVRYARPQAKALDQRVSDHAGAVKMAVVHRVRALGHDRAPSRQER